YMLHLPECVLILDELKNNLPTYIDYHNVGHTIDVFNAALSIADDERVGDYDRKLLGVAAIYHDAGYLRKCIGHEELSCEIAAEYLARFNYSSTDIETICGMILATRVPQKPSSFLQQIICDADMDYLGRDDFFTLGDRLYNELYQQKTVSDKLQWDLMQIDLLKQHHYFMK